MHISNKLQILYIPAEYWNSPISEFSLESKKTLPQSASFFILWHPLVEDEKLLSTKISEVFPDIPVQKLLFCSINLAFPERNGISNQIFKLRKFSAKIVPLSPGLELLLNFKLSSEGLSEKEIKKYASSVKAWTLLTKLAFELLNRGRFIPTLEKFDKKESLFHGHWKMVLNSDNDKSRLKKIIDASNWINFNLPLVFDEKSGIISQLWHPSHLYSEFIDRVGDYLIRLILKRSKFRTFKEFYNIEFDKEKSHKGSLAWDFKFLKSLISKENQFPITQFHETIVPQVINDWTRIANLTSKIGNFSIILKLNYPDESNNQNSEEWVLEIFIKLAEKEDLLSFKKFWKDSSLRNNFAASVFMNEKDIIETILLTISNAAKVFRSEEHTSELQ